MISSRFASFLAPLFLCAVCEAAGPASDYVAAVVNDTIITFSQVRALSAADVERLSRTETEENLRAAIKSIRASALDRLIDRQLVIQEFKRRSTAALPQFEGDRQQWLNQLRQKAYIRTFGTLLEDCPAPSPKNVAIPSITEELAPSGSRVMTVSGDWPQVSFTIKPDWVTAATANRKR